VIILSAIIKSKAKYVTIKNKYLGLGYNIVELDENKLNQEYVFNEFSNALKFPSYFGKNWNALWDCVTDLEWLKEKNTVVLIKKIANAPELQNNEILHSQLNDAEKYWRKNGVSFKVYNFT
jgi:hypothetical protein